MNVHTELRQCFNGKQFVWVTEKELHSCNELGTRFHNSTGCTPKPLQNPCSVEHSVEPGRYQFIIVIPCPHILMNSLNLFKFNNMVNS